MEPFALVNHAIDLLSAHLPGAADIATDVGEAAAARGLYELVAARLRKRGEAEAVTEFAAHPRNNSLIKRLVRQEVRDDPEFAADLARAVAAVGAPTPALHVVHQSGNTAGGDVVGRDSIRHSNSHNTTSTTHNKKSSYGGLVLGAVVIVALLLVFVVGKAILGAIPLAGLNAKSTCTDYLQSADEAGKAAVMKKLYIDKNKPHLAADPFINQNTSYFCGERPTMTLDRLASVRSDG